MKKGILLSALFLTIGLMFTSCSKYEDGPKLSLRTKTARIANEWVTEKYIDAQGNETTPTSNDFSMKIEKDGTGQLVYGSISTDIEWEFDSAKEKIHSRSKNIVTNQWEAWGDYETITRLKNDELWVKDDDGSAVHYKTK
jgi:hypothetical protein